MAILIESVTTAAADVYTGWVEAEARGLYNTTVSWRTTQNPPADIAIQSKLKGADDSTAVVVSTITPGTGNITGMRTDAFSGHRLWRVGIPSGESVSAAHTLTIQV